jgi:FkbM family methyltransferase
MNYSGQDSKGDYLDSKLNNIINKDDGFFIELGAHNGLIQSNTAYFEFNRKWKGILIEPSYNKLSECKINRPNSICLHYACVSNDYEKNTIFGDFMGGMMASINGKRIQSTNIVEVPAISLENILDQYPRNNIDFLSIDTEGYELNVLQGLNLNKYRPTYILIEIYNDQYDSIILYLLNHNYKLHSNLTNFNNIDNPNWDGTHNDYLFVNNQI